MTNENNHCPDPVIAADGHTYERSGIAEWLTNHTTSPVTRAVLKNQELTPNHQLKSQIEQCGRSRKESLRGSRGSMPSWPRFTFAGRVRMRCPRCLL